MKALILAAGYGTRLYPITMDSPKPLLKIGDKLLIDHIVCQINQLREIDEIVVVTNEKFFSNFDDWKNNTKTCKKISVINDGSTSNETRLGAIKDLQLAVERANINEDLLVIGGDNLFDFDLHRFTDFAAKKKTSCVAAHDIGSLGKAKSCGVLTVDESNKVIDFTEKPENPETTLVAICMYYFPADKLGKIKEYLESSAYSDAPGHYVSWLSKNDTVCGFVFNEDWYDIGSIDSYDAAQKKYSSK
jgi:glucose-1-phosphate thymidylyltransferase